MLNISKIVGIFILGMSGGIFAEQILWPYFIERPLFYQYKLEQGPVLIRERKEIIIRENTALETAVAKAEKAVIGVKTKETLEGKEIILEGSGLAVTSDGLIVTLASLVPRGAAFSFFIDGKPASFQILKRDLENNLALLKIEGANLSALPFADLEKIKPGQRVFLVGTRAVNEGIIRSFDENLIETNIFEDITLSGSPLFDIEGGVLGLNTLDKEGRIVAIPVSKIKQFAGF